MTTDNWKLTANQEIFNDPETEDPHNGKLVTYFCASCSEISYHVTIFGDVDAKMLAAGLRNLADRLSLYSK